MPSFFLKIFDIESLIRYGGLLLVFFAVYGQTGLFFCFFLPSGALMFTSGVFAASGDMHYNVFVVCGLLIVAAELGNLTGYWFGRKTGPLLYKRRESKYFRQEHLKTAEKFYAKYGGIALTAGLFFPIIRTFSPIVSGIIKVNFRKFLLYTSAGSSLYVTSFVLAGYLLGSMPFLKPYLKYVLIAIIVLVTIPVIIRIVREFKKPMNKH
jgi:membrane-associated protein